LNLSLSLSLPPGQIFSSLKGAKNLGVGWPQGKDLRIFSITLAANFLE
jgi:hypothetical protein